MQWGQSFPMRALPSQATPQSFPPRALPSQAPCALVASAAHSAVCTDCCCGGVQKGVAVEDSSAVVKVPGPAFFITAHAPGCRVVGEGKARDRASICVLPPYPSRAAVLTCGLHRWQQQLHLKSMGPGEPLAGTHHVILMDAHV